MLRKYYWAEQQRIKENYGALQNADGVQSIASRLSFGTYAALGTGIIVLALAWHPVPRLAGVRALTLRVCQAHVACKTDQGHHSRRTKSN